MPSWNVHLALAERLLDEGALANRPIGGVGLLDANAFLFGNCVPDVYVGFMVPDASFHVDYCLSHLAAIDTIPVPDADLFWDNYVARRAPATPEGLSLALGAWVHLLADRFYNGRFRTFWNACGAASDETLRKDKQSDFDLFGRSLPITRRIDVTPGLIDAAKGFRAYSILPEDVVRAIEVANRIAAEGGVSSSEGAFKLLTLGWMQEVLDACAERALCWMQAWQTLGQVGGSCLAADVRLQAGLPPAFR